MGRPKDKFWEYADNLNGRFVCKFCQKEFSGSISRVKSHLSGQTGRDIVRCEKVPEDVQELANLAICSNKKINTGSSSEVRANDVCSTPHITSSNVLCQPTISEVWKEGNEDMVDKLVAEAVIVNGIPFDVIQSPSFIAMCKGIADHGPGYTLPRDLELGCKKDVEEYVSKVKESWASTGCTLMLKHFFGNKFGALYAYVIAYSPGGAIFLECCRADDESEMLLEVVKEIDAENVVQIIIEETIGGKDFNCKVCDLIVEIYPHIYITSGSDINFLLHDIYVAGFWKEMKQIFDDAKLIVDYMHSHMTITNLMRDRMGGKELKKPGESGYHWYLYFLMLRSVVNAENDLRALVVSPEWGGMDCNKSTQAKRVMDIIKGPSFWAEGRDMLSILEPLIELFLLVNCGGSTYPYLYVAMERAREVIKSCYDNDRTKYLYLWELFDSRKKQIFHEMHAVASFFDPSLFYNGKIMYDIPEVKDGMNCVVEKLIQPNERANFASQLLLYIRKSTKLFNTLSLELMTQAHPRVWWELYGGEVPLLRKIAIRILSQPCGLSLRKRNWEALEACIERNNLILDMRGHYMRMNFFMMTNLDKSQMGHKKATDLDKCDELYEEFENEWIVGSF